MSDPAYEVLHGLTIALPNGKTLVTTKPLLFPQATRWLRLQDAWNRGSAYGDSLGIIFTELPEAVGVADMSVLDDLTFGEVVDQTLIRFLFHRRPPAAFQNPPASPVPAPAPM